MKTVIITGANGNLGSAVTKEFLDKGYKVIVTVAMESMKSDFTPTNNLDVQVVDLMKEDEAGSFVQSVIARYGKVDGALLLVGGFAMGNIAATTGADLKKQFSLNFETAYYITRPLFQHMLQNKNGRIVFIGARPALLAEQGKNLIAYGLSKSLLFKLAEYLNEEAKGTNVTVTVVAPSTLDTALNRKSMPDVDPNIWVKPQQIAELLEFIVSDKSSPLRETVLKVYNNA
ncbi:MAG TPA: SDR family NAD(P)-dependent oxidoreductase [Puia sp.]|nr:SDR family NAD(P)-dependent oxidoreductase [Puia sp.]